MTLFTAAIALERFGPAYQFRTQILRDGALLPDGTIDGDLYIKGAGDPSIAPRYARWNEGVRPMDALVEMVVASGVTLDLSSQAANPAGQAFGAALGDAGLRIFGAIFWAAAISSVIGAAYTSATFLSTFSKRIFSGWGLQLATVAFIVVSLIVYLLIGTAPAAILVFVGGFNGLILPIGLSIFMYIGWFRSKDVLGGYRYPKWLLVLGTLATLLSFYMGAISIGPIFAFLGIGA